MINKKYSNRTIETLIPIVFNRYDDSRISVYFEKLQVLLLNFQKQESTIVQKTNSFQKQLFQCGETRRKNGLTCVGYPFATSKQQEIKKMKKKRK